MKRNASIEAEHVRAICAEIGERLRIALDKSASPAPEYLMSLVARLDHPTHRSPSIAAEDFAPDEHLRSDYDFSYLLNPSEQTPA
jgi:hypothetical protein